MKISYAVTTHNETEEINELLGFLIHHMATSDEIVILDDFSNEETQEVFRSWTAQYGHNIDIKIEQRALNGNFAAHKNFMNDQCTGDWIFNIDADEMPHKNLVENIKPLIEANPTIELFWVPRINTVQGLTDEHCAKWRWRVNDKGWVNYPDPQQRIYKNSKRIRWSKPVHERLLGATKDTMLPYEEEWSFYHVKTIIKQEKQNEFYGGILKNA